MWGFSSTRAGSSTGFAVIRVCVAPWHLPVRQGSWRPVRCASLSFERALKIDEACFGPEHYKVAIRLINLAHLLQSTNRPGEAEPLMCRALHIIVTSLGIGHPSTQTVKNNYAALLEAMGRTKKQVQAQLNAAVGALQ